MKIYGLQLDIAWENKARNRERLGEWLKKLAPEPGSLVVLPELTCIGFSMRRDGLAEEPEQETQQFYAQLAQQYQITLVAGLSWWGEEGRGLNVALVVGPQGESLGSYAKTHPFSFSGEDQHYQAGQQRFLFEWEGLQVAPLICYDLRFPETFRHLALDGAELFLVIANWPSPRVHHWESLLVARAIENQAYVLGVNRCGRDPQVAYPGSSRLIDPQGRVVAQLGEDEAHLEAFLDLQELRAYRQRFPALQDLIKAELGR
jgi:omega-amidase